MDDAAARGIRAAEALAETWGSTADACHALVENEWQLATECPGWSVKDQLSHLIAVERLLLGDAPPTWDGPLGDHVRNEFGAQLEPWIAVRRSLTGDEVLAEFRQVTALRLEALGARSAGEWAALTPSPAGGEVPYAQFMEVRVFDSWVHEQDVRLALDRPGGEAGTAAGIALDAVQKAMGYVVGKKAAAPDGTVVRFVITGPSGAARDFSLAVEAGRASAAVGDPAPTAVLTLSAVDFTRLGCGRADAAQIGAAGGIGMEGDPVIGQAVLSQMNFMF